MLIEATHKCGHKAAKDFKSRSLMAIHWQGRIETTRCNMCRLAALEADLQAVDLDTLRAVVRKCHNVPRLVALLHKAATK